jgi:ribosomal protein S26
LDPSEEYQVLLKQKAVFMLMMLMVGTINAREYRIARSLPENMADSLQQVTIHLYGSPKGGEALEMHQLSAEQWQLRNSKAGDGSFQGFVDSNLPLPLWAEIEVGGDRLEQRAALNAPGDITVSGEVAAKGGVRFNDNSLQTTAVDAGAVNGLLGGNTGSGTACAAGSSIRAIAVNGTVSCEADDVGAGTVTQITAGVGLSGGTVTNSGIIAIAAGGVAEGMIADSAVTSIKIADGAVGVQQVNVNQVQRRVAGSCPVGYLMTGINVDGSLQCQGTHKLLPRRLDVVTVDPASSTGGFSSLVLDANDNPVISYTDFANSDLKLAHCKEPYCALKTLVTVDATGDVGLYTSLVLDASGNPVISYYDVSNGNLKLAHCNDANCFSKTVMVVDVTDDVGQYTSLALDAGGNPVISYYDVTNGDLKLAYCGDANCSSKTLTTVDATDDIGQYTSMVLDVSGNPVIAYYDVTNADLKLVHCSNVDCSSKSMTTVDAVDNVGEFLSLVLDADENPVISYYDATNANLKLARCSDSNCSAKTVVAVDATGAVGQYSSLALDADNNPVIGYRDATSLSPKLVHCNDANCSDAVFDLPDIAATNAGYYLSLVLDIRGNPVVSYYEAVGGPRLKLVR